MSVKTKVTVPGRQLRRRASLSRRPDSCVIAEPCQAGPPGASISSTRTPLHERGWMKATGPSAPLRAALVDQLDPLRQRAGRSSASTSATSRQTWWKPSPRDSRKRATPVDGSVGIDQLDLRLAHRAGRRCVTPSDSNGQERRSTRQAQAGRGRSASAASRSRTTTATWCTREGPESGNSTTPERINGQQSPKSQLGPCVAGLEVSTTQRGPPQPAAMRDRSMSTTPTRMSTGTCSTRREAAG